MNCPIQKKQGEEILLDYCSGRLHPDRTAEVEAHAKICTECSQWIANQSAVWSALDDFAAPAVSPEFQARVYQQLEAEPSGGSWKHLWLSAWKPTLAAAAVAAALVVGVMIRTVPVPEPSKKASIESVDMDQVENALDDLDLLTPGDGASRL
ncbi:MAG: hypothetical protein ABL967_08695 [Bryobacteraceae bacterium]